MLEDLRQEIIRELAGLAIPELSTITEVFSSSETGRTKLGIRLVTKNDRVLFLTAAGEFWELEKYFQWANLSNYSLDEIVVGLQIALTNVTEKREKLERVLTILRERRPE